MALFKRGNIWHAYVSIDGTRHHKSTGTSNRRQAEAILRQFHDELNERRHRLPNLKPEMTFGELAALFIGSGVGTSYSLDRLKHLLTGGDIELEQKFGHRIRMKSMHRMIMTSNHANAIEITEANGGSSCSMYLIRDGETIFISCPFGAPRMARTTRPLPLSCTN